MSTSTHSSECRTGNRWKPWIDMGSPVFISAPMVWQSERTFRMLTREHGANLCYTPMIHADKFLRSYQRQQDVHSQTSTTNRKPWEYDDFDNVSCDVKHQCDAETFDRPLILQFCATKVDDFVAAATLAERAFSGCIDGIELNLGCPQKTAKKNGFGAFLMDSPETVFEMIRCCTEAIRLPVSAKIRLLETSEKTIAFAQMLSRAGVSWITVHARQRTQRNHTGVVAYNVVAAVVAAVPEIPIVANGGITCVADVHNVIAQTHVAGCMVASALLRNPALFEKEIDSTSAALLYLRTCEKTTSPNRRFITSHMKIMLEKHLMLSPPLHNMFYLNTTITKAGQFIELLRILVHEQKIIIKTSDSHDDDDDDDDDDNSRPLLSFHEIKYMSKDGGDNVDGDSVDASDNDDGDNDDGDDRFDFDLF